MKTRTAFDQRVALPAAVSVVGGQLSEVEAANMTTERAGTLEEKVTAAIEVVEHLIAICRGFESDEWLAKFLVVRDALVSGRYKDAVREEARLTRNTIPTKWDGSRYMERRLEEVLGVLHRHISYPNHSEPAAQVGDLPSDVTVNWEAEIRARRVELATVGYLKVTDGVFAGQVVALRAGRTSIGRHPTCQIVIADPIVSRQHAEVVENGGRFFIADLIANNATYLNGTRINDKTELMDGDGIRIRDHAFQFFLQVPNPREASPTPTQLRPQNLHNAWVIASKTALAQSSLDLLLEKISQKGLEQVMAEEQWPGGPRHAWKIDVVELGHLKAICANPDDAPAWLAYADWLDERGDGCGEFLRALMMPGTLSNADDRFQPLRGRCIELWERVDWEWGAAILGLRKSRILNCAAAPPGEPQVRFAFQCPNQWGSLEPGEDGSVRFCKDCSKNVYFCRTAEEAQERGIAGNCIAISSRLALRVERTANEAHQLMRTTPMLMGLPIHEMPNPIADGPDPVPYQTWGDILFATGNRGQQPDLPAAIPKE